MTVLAICHACKAEIRPLRGQSYAAVFRAGRWRPVCIDCHREVYA